MERKDRVQLLETSLSALVNANDKAYVVFENVDDPDQYVQFTVHDGRVYGEVGSREWTGPARPLDGDAVIDLGLRGFVGGGERQNFSRDDLTRDPAELATLAEQLLRLAYGETDMQLIVSTNDAQISTQLIGAGIWVKPHEPVVPADAASRVDPEDVRQAVERRCSRVFTGPSGELLTWFAWDPATDAEIKAWFKVECDGNVYRIAGSTDRPIRKEERSQVLNFCNEWNRGKRWPKAYLWDEDRGGHQVYCWIDVVMDLPGASGVHQAMIEDFTDVALRSFREFFQWLHQKRGELSGPTAASGDRRAGYGA